MEIVQWIRGSSLAWANQYNKSVQQISTTRIPSHTVIPTITVRNGGAHLFDSVMCLVCHVLRSVIKKSEHYSLQGVIVVEEKGRDVAANRKSVLLPNSAAPVCCKESSHILNTSDTHIQGKSKGKGRVGKGTHGLSIVRHLLTDKEKWIIPKKVRDCHFPGTSGEQSVFYFEDCQAIYSTCPLDPHYCGLIFNCIMPMHLASENHLKNASVTTKNLNLENLCLVLS